MTTNLILGPDGHPVSSQTESTAQAAPLVPGGHMNLPGLGVVAGVTPGHTGGWTYADPAMANGPYGGNRHHARQLCRALYFMPNPLFRGAIQLVTAFLSGDHFTYAPHEDKDVNRALDQFWQANSLGELFTFRFLTELYLDGENATVFPTGDDDPGPNMPARIAFLDVNEVLLDWDTRRGAVASDMATRVRVSDGPGRFRTWEAGEFSWTAFDAMYNDARGWPIALGAAHAAVAYVAMANNRLNLHEVQQRIIAVYTAAMNPAGTDPQGRPDGGMSQWNAKRRAFAAIPERGGVFPLVTSPGWQDAEGRRYDGFTEKLEFPHPARGATEAAHDQRTFLRMVGLALGGLPEHWLGEGNNANRATASEMNTPAIRLGQQRQGLGRAWLDRVFRMELKRRYGPDKLYTTYRYEGQGAGRRRKRLRVPADLIEINWSFPNISQESLEVLLKRAQAASKENWASPETLSASVGFDPAVEESQLAARGLPFGKSAATTNTPPANAKAGKGGDDDAKDPAPDPADDPA
ncbi:hypothetical protein [Deinococcus multiflagellatus]|nr:hypothetical protein [Deinococcus multiflagellatus]MBZ9715285.1 hypothetical protein [Deinococcus multiflagellatus]